MKKLAKSLKNVTLKIYHNEKYLNIRISEEVKTLCLRTCSCLSGFLV